MRFTHSFAVRAGVDEVFELLTDLTRVARCVPDARLEVTGPKELVGSVPLQLRMLPVSYQGSAHLAEADPDARTATIKAQGHQRRGEGYIEATLRVELFERGASTRVKVTAEAVLRGAPAQLPDGTLRKLGERFLDDLGSCLGAQLTGESAAAVSPAGQQGDGRYEGEGQGLNLVDSVAALGGRDVQRMVRIGRLVRRLVDTARRGRPEPRPAPAPAATPTASRAEIARRAAPVAGLGVVLAALFVWWRSR